MFYAGVGEDVEVFETSWSVGVESVQRVSVGVYERRRQCQKCHTLRDISIALVYITCLPTTVDAMRAMATGVRR